MCEYCNNFDNLLHPKHVLSHWALLLSLLPWFLFLDWSGLPSFTSSPCLAKFVLFCLVIYFQEKDLSQSSFHNVIKTTETQTRTTCRKKQQPSVAHELMPYQVTVPMGQCENAHVQRLGRHLLFSNMVNGDRRLRKQRCFC